MMPHPERAFMMWQNPYYPGDLGLGAKDPGPWLKMFQNARVWSELQAASNRVTISSEYQAKINSLLANYNREQAGASVSAPVEGTIPRQTLTLSEEELESARKKVNPVVLFALRVVAVVQAFFSWVKHFFFGL